MSVLIRSEIEERLKKDRAGDDPEIFMPRTWDEDHLRGAGYDLRVSAQVRALNDEIYARNRPEEELLSLQPGDTAFVVSVEQFIMPWDLAANLGPRFSFARQGLSVLTGLLVDPGFGWRKREGEWVADGAPLHFFLSNVGADTIQIKLGDDGDGVLSIQFLRTTLVKPEEREVTTPPGDIAPAKALGVFRDIRKMEAELRRDRGDNQARHRRLSTDISELESGLEITRSATNNTVVFGVFILSITLAGVVAAILLESLTGDHIETLIDHLNELEGSEATLALVATLGAIVAIFAIVALCVAKLFALRLERGQQKAKEEQGAGAESAPAD